MRKRQRSKLRGFIMLDVVSGLLLMLVTVMLLAGVTTRSRIAAGRLADERAAMRLAEMTLLRLAADGDAVRDDAVGVTSIDATAPSGLRWVTATSNVNGRSVSLVGLVRMPAPATAPATMTGGLP